MQSKGGFGASVPCKSNNQIQYLMNKQKLTYLSPETETLVVRFEGMICTSDRFGAIMAAGLFFSEDNSNINDYTTGEDF